MSEQRATQQGQAVEKSPLKGARGETTIQDTVVARIAGIAAQEVDGVHPGGGASRAVGGILDSVTGSVTGGGTSGGGQTRGVSVEVGEIEAAIDFTMAIAYGKSVPQVAGAVRKNIINRVENLTGLRVTEVNITVNDVIFPDDESDRGGAS